MNVVERAHDGYGKSSAHLKSPRDAEYKIIARISHRLREAAAKRETDFPTYVSALHDNNKLWTALATDLASPGNTLPAELKARLLWLADFTRNETQRLLKKDGDVAVLIEINAAILQGLHDYGDQK